MIKTRAGGKEKMTTGEMTIEGEVKLGGEKLGMIEGVMNIAVIQRIVDEIIEIIVITEGIIEEIVHHQ